MERKPLRKRSNSTKVQSSRNAVNTPPRPPRPERFDIQILSDKKESSDKNNSPKTDGTLTHPEIPPKPLHLRKQSKVESSNSPPNSKKLKRLYSKSTRLLTPPKLFDNIDENNSKNNTDTNLASYSLPVFSSPIKNNSESLGDSPTKENSDQESRFDERGRRYTEGKPRSSDYYNLGIVEKKSKLSKIAKGLKELFPSKHQDSSMNLKQYDEDDSVIFILWISSKRPLQKWKEFDLSQVPEDVISMIDSSIIDGGHHVEFGMPKEDQDDVKVIKSPVPSHSQDEEEMLSYKSEYIPFYTFYLYPLEHTNFLGYDEESNIHWVITLEDKSPNKKRDLIRVLVRSKKGYYRYCIENTTSGNRLLPLYKFIPEIEKVKFIKVKSYELSEELHSMEMKEISLGTRYKFGVLYVKPDQNEDQIYANDDITPDFQEFLEFLGEKIELKDWSKYNGGLDTKSDSTGTHSYFTSIYGTEIMFHVCPLLPSQVEDVQRVERKRHIGNDVVVFVFLEEGCKNYHSTILTSKFIHIQIVIQKVKKTSEDEITKYKVGIITKAGVEPHKPNLPATSIIEKTPENRELLLRKAINAERTTLFSPEFRTKIIRTRKDFLSHLYETYGVKKKK